MTSTIELATDKGWGAYVIVKVAPTPEAEAAALAFFKRTCAYEFGQENYHVATPLDGEFVTNELINYFFPLCEHQMSAMLCAGPNHYPMDREY
jgi:hypothetical protein